MTQYWEQLFSCKLSSSPSSSSSSLFHSSSPGDLSPSSSSSSGIRIRQGGSRSSSINGKRKGVKEGSSESKEALHDGLDEDDDRISLSGHSSLPTCSPFSRIDESIGYSQETKVQFVVDAVYAFAHALHAAWLDLCRGKQRVCKELKELDGGTFYSKYLLKINFTGKFQ